MTSISKLYLNFESIYKILLINQPFPFTEGVLYFLSLAWSGSNWIMPDKTLPDIDIISNSKEIVKG